MCYKNEYYLIQINYDLCPPFDTTFNIVESTLFLKYKNEIMNTRITNFCVTVMVLCIFFLVQRVIFLSNITMVGRSYFWRSIKSRNITEIHITTKI